MENRFIIIDGHSLMFRAFYAMQNPMITKEGIYTQGIFGFLRMLEKIKKEFPAGYICVAFDTSAPTFRHEAFDEYKAGRKSMPPELSMQMPLIHDILEAMNIKVMEMEGYEADDLIGTLARKGEVAGLEPLIITGDKDELQLATKITKVMITKKGISEFEIYDEDAMIEKYGMTPAQFIDLKGLMGDSSDNYPGIPGVGEKTATKLILEFGSVENLLANTDKLKGKQKEKVEENKDLALLCKRLATIVTDAPVELNKDELTWGEGDAKALLAIYKRLEFNSFIKSLDLSSIGNEEIQMETEVEIEDIAKLIDEAEIKVLATDVEISTMADAIADKEVVIKGFGDGEAFGLYVDNKYYYCQLDSESKKQAFCQAIKGAKLCGYDLKQEFLRLMAMGMADFKIGYDVCIAQYILEPARKSYELDVLSKEYLSYDLESEKEFADRTSQATLFSDNSNDEAKFGLACAVCAGQLNRIQKAQIESEELNAVYYDIELPLVEVMASMEFLGFAADSKVLDEIGASVSSRIDELTKEIHELAGEEFNIKSPAQLGPILFEKLALPGAKKTKKGYSTGAEILEKIKDEHPIIPLILEYRAITKIMGTYIEGLIPLIKNDGKIHAHFNQTITTTGRISSSDPNLQNIPVRSELGRSIRKAFVPDEGCLLMGADYSQIELRVLAHMSQDETLIDAFNRGEDIHRATAANVLGIAPEDITPLERSRAKAVNFGIIYGMSSFGLSEELGITRKDAEHYIENYFAKHERVKAFMDELVETAKTKGFVSTVFGRRRYINEINSSNYMIREAAKRLAMNSPIQGTAADIIKIAMVNIYKALLPYKSNLILQVHDELIINTYKDEEAEVKQLLHEAMEKAMEMTVELVIDLNEGDSWFQLK